MRVSNYTQVASKTRGFSGNDKSFRQEKMIEGLAFYIGII